MKNKYIFPIFGIILVVATLAAYSLGKNSDVATINSFEDCVAAGYPVMEIYPEQCAVPGGELFTRNIVDPSAPLPPEGGSEEDVFCTMDAMECPDGSFVGRVGPNCEFEVCPSL